MQLTESTKQQQAQEEQLNEYLYSFLKQSSLSTQLVEEVGSDFIDLNLPDIEGYHTTRSKLSVSNEYERETTENSRYIYSSNNEGETLRAISYESLNA